MSIVEQSKKSPQVSVLMPIYKTPEKYLQEAVESILNQTFTDFELLILDDCPEQPCEDIIKSYKDERIKYIKNPHNIGISAARNALIDMAQGKYLAILDHDDVALPKRLEKQVGFLEMHPEVGVVGTWYERFPKTKIKKQYVLNSQIERDLMQNCSILHPSSMIRKSVLLENDIHYNGAYSPAEDYMLWLSLLGKTEFANIPEVLQKYRDHGSNTSKTQSEKMKKAADAIHRFLQEKHPDMWAKACFIKNIKLFGLPLLKYESIGCTRKYTLFGIFKFRTREAVKF